MVQHIAGRSSAKEKNANLIEAIKAAGFPHDRYQTTTIVNTDDAIPGTGMFVRNSIESNKSSSHGRNLSSTAMARCGRPGSWTRRAQRSWCWIRTGVQWAKDGALTQQEVQQVIDLLHKLLNK